MTAQRVQVLERSFDLIAALADGPKTLTQAVVLSGLPKGTAFRLLTALAYRDMVIKDTVENVYMLGPGFLRLAQSSGDAVGALLLGQPSLARLRGHTEETILIHVRMATTRVCVSEVQSEQPIRYIAPVGSVAPLHVGSAGRILLAFMDDDERAPLLAHLPLVRLTEATVVDPAVLLEQMAEARARGWAMSSGERVVGASAISVPVRGPRGSLFALSVLGPDTRFTEERRLGLLEPLRATAAELEGALGFDDPSSSPSPPPAAADVPTAAGGTR